MPIMNLQQAIAAQAEINLFLAANGIRDLVGDYGEMLVHCALGGIRQHSVNRGFDIAHPDFRRIEVKTRQYKLRQDGSVRKEDRADGFTGKEAGFDWLVHVVLAPDFSVVTGCRAQYEHVWPIILRTTMKISFDASSTGPSSVDITDALRAAQRQLGFGY